MAFASGIVLLSMMAPACAFDLRLSDSTDDWLCAATEARHAVASTLSLIAGQGLVVADERYFFSCIDEYALSLGSGAARLNDLGSSCAFLLTTPFADSD
jgi:hypothetical protein